MSRENVEILRRAISHLNETGEPDLQSGVELEAVEGWVTWIREGRITRIQQHPGKQEALEAAGLA